MRLVDDKSQKYATFIDDNAQGMKERAEQRGIENARRDQLITRVYTSGHLSRTDRDR